MNVEYKLDYEKINKAFGKNYQIFRRKTTYVLPLPTREPDRAKFERGFISVVGGIVRRINEKSINEEKDYNIDDKLDNNVSFINEDSRKLFNQFVQAQLEELYSGQIDSLQQLEQVPLAVSTNEQKGEKDYINFFYDTFIRGDEDYVKGILERMDSSHIVNEILSYIVSNEENSPVKKQHNQLYKTHFEEFRTQFLKDLNLLASSETFFFENIAKLCVHYTSVAISQTVLQTNHMADFNQEEFVPVYYIMYWEKAAKWRASYEQGFKMLREQISDFYAHEHALNILGLNTFTSESNMFYHDLKQFLHEAGPDAEKEFTKSIYNLMKDVYEKEKGIEVTDYEADKTLDDAFFDLFNTVKQTVSSEINSRYPKAFEALITGFFRKNGGPLGTLISLNRDQLLLLVALSVGPNRIELNQLWKELEKHGVWLDYLSKEEVINVLDKLNYMEKKSDSGDAQYVKSIL